MDSFPEPCPVLGMRVGDEVSVYVDLDRGCRKGLTKPYEGRKLFVGNGMALCSRQDVFCSKEKTRYVITVHSIRISEWVCLV